MCIFIFILTNSICFSFSFSSHIYKEDIKRKITKNQKKYEMGCVRPLGSEVHYLLVYWACGPSQGQGPARGGEAFVRRDCVEK